MPQLLHQFKPALFPAVLPHFLKWLWRYAVAGLIVYGLLYALDAIGVLRTHMPALLMAVALVVPLASFISIKHRLIRLHNTRYLFYDTHVVSEHRFITVTRHSVPYAQINKLTNNSSIWNRMTGVSDIILHTLRHGDAQDLVLRSVRDPDEVEHTIYDLLKRSRRSEPEDEIA